MSSSQIFPTVLVVLSLGLGCTPAPESRAPASAERQDPASLVPAALASTIARWREVIAPIVKAAIADHRCRGADHRLGSDLGCVWTPNELAKIEATLAEARRTIETADPEHRPWLLVAYLEAFGVVGLGSAWANAAVTVPANHPAWATTALGLFDALHQTTEPEQVRRHIAAIAAAHANRHVEAGAVYLELQDADWAGNWPRARTLFGQLQSIQLSATQAGIAAADFLDPDRPLRAGKPMPKFCAPAIAGPHAGNIMCLDEQFPADQRTLIIAWATWCGACNEALPRVVELARGRGLRVVTINYDNQPELARARLRELGVGHWEILHVDAESRKRRQFSADFDVQPIPFMALVDERGIVEAGPPWLDAETLPDWLP